jgi:ribose transport system ATP-binding protein
MRADRARIHRAASTRDMPVSTPLLELRGITKSFSGFRVLEGVDFDVHPAEVHALAGENGAGKSTLMNIVSGVLAADAGEILWEGRSVHLRSPRDAQNLGIAFVHQELALAPDLSAAENIFLGRHPASRGWIRWRELFDRARELLSGLGHNIDPRAPVGRLSLAQRQLVEIARALAFRSRLIIMDEPTAPLTAHDAEGLFRTIAALRGRGVSVIYITHRLQEIFDTSDRVTVMRDGRRVLACTAADTTPAGLVRAMVGDELECKLQADMPPVLSTGAERLSAGRVNVHRGEVVGLAGLAGAGRTELLEWIFGAHGPAAHILVDGKPVAIRSPRDAIREGLALVPDDRKAKGLVLGASLCENIALPAGRGRVFLRAAAERAATHRLAGELRIRAASIDQPLLHLSGGNQQKAVLAKWLHAGAGIFLLDEPTRGVDVRSKAEIYEIIRGLCARGCAVLLASSEMEELLALSHRIVVLHRGRVAGELARADATEERIMHLATGGDR